MRRDVYRKKMVLGCSVVISLTLLAGLGAAAPATEKASVEKTVFDPVISKPVWVSDQQTRLDPMWDRATMHGWNGPRWHEKQPPVTVPSRPSPRSPYIPSAGLCPLPPWIH